MSRDKFDLEELEDRKLVEEMMVNLIEGMRADRERWANKRESELWRGMSAPFNLRVFLERLTKDELINIRKNLNLKGISSLNKKQLTDVLEEELVGSLEQIISSLDSNQYKDVNRIINNNGIAQLKLANEAVEFYRELGIIFPCTVDGKRVLVMPNELVAKFNNLDKNIILSKTKRNTQWVRITQGLLFYYGTLRFSQLIDMVGKYTEPIDLYEAYNDFYHALNNAQKYYGEINVHYNIYSNYRVFDDEKILEEHSQRSSVEFYPFTYEQLYRAGEAGFVEKNHAFKNFSKFLVENYEITVKEADSFVEECVFAIRLGEEVKDILDYLGQHFEIDSLEVLQEFTKLITQLNNNTRQWVLKGYTSSELFESEQKYLQPLPSQKLKLVVDNTKAANKVGRNDPCPCGSGKKYKKCCGK